MEFQHNSYTSVTDWHHYLSCLPSHWQKYPALTTLGYQGKINDVLVMDYDVFAYIIEGKMFLL